MLHCFSEEKNQQQDLTLINNFKLQAVSYIVYIINKCWNVLARC